MSFGNSFVYQACSGMHMHASCWFPNCLKVIWTPSLFVWGLYCLWRGMQVWRQEPSGSWYCRFCLVWSANRGHDTSNGKHSRILNPTKSFFFTIFVLRISRHESSDSNKSPFPSGLLKSTGLRNLKDIESVSRFQVRQTFVKLLATLRELLRWQGASWRNGTGNRCSCQGRVVWGISKGDSSRISIACLQQNMKMCKIYVYIYIYGTPPKVYHFKLHKIGLGVPYINTL